MADPASPHTAQARGDNASPSDLEHAVEVARALVAAIAGTTISRVAISVGAIHVEVEADRRDAAASTSAAAVTPAPIAPAVPDQGGAALHVAPVDAGAAAADVSTPSASQERVTAPLVGVFYRRSEPGKPPLVEVGDRVEPGQVLAIVEAMKMMNEVVAGTAGTVVGIHAEDQDVVEFEQLLFTIAAPV